MQTEQPTKCFEPFQELRARLVCCKIDLSPPVIYNWPFQCGISVVVFYCLFLESVLVMFHLMYVQIVFSLI